MKKPWIIVLAVVVIGIAVAVVMIPKRLQMAEAQEIAAESGKYYESDIDRSLDIIKQWDASDQTKWLGTMLMMKNPIPPGELQSMANEMDDKEAEIALGMALDFPGMFDGSMAKD